MIELCLLTDEFPVAHNVYSRATRKAVALHYGKDKLARYLNVSITEIDKWLAGTEPPRDIFLRIIDIILDETEPPDGSSEASDSAPPRDCASGRSVPPAD
jgi:hypothetical protein